MENDAKNNEKPENYINDEKPKNTMVTKRRNIKGTYYSVRQKNTSKGSKGTIKGKWSSKSVPLKSKDKKFKKR